MKDTHEMTRLELENEVNILRKKVQELEVKISQKDFIIRVYGDNLDEQNVRYLSRNLQKKK